SGFHARSRPCTLVARGSASDLAPGASQTPNPPLLPAPPVKIESSERTKVAEEGAGGAAKGGERLEGESKAGSMPGVIMENGSRNGSHTNHDRDQRPNGIHGANYASEKGKNRAEPPPNVTPHPTASNGLNGKVTERQQNGEDGTIPQDVKAQIDQLQLPPEILHITDGFLPLSSLLSRLAHKTHNDLSKTILDMAQMPLPASATNGNASHAMANDDNSQENLAKKLKLLNFAQDAHTEWTKALIITNWSRRSEEINKLIDLRLHLYGQKELYRFAIDGLAELKKNLVQARLPNPDLKTALAVLTTGKAPWMPELGYIQPPPLTAKEILKSLENLNTLLSIRLNLHEYDKIPFHFTNYTIQSGRVTFDVAGEFAVDLTIADEDPETQFWFIDFRFLFSPSLSEMPPHVRGHIDARVNESLMKDGLSGCYKFLHNMVLTHKISEYRRQAVDLARGKWIEGLKVESLNRALSIQYWLDRYGRKGPKSWIILGVHSGKRKIGRSHPKDTSRLFIRWFRDSKEVQDVDIPFNAVDISAELLLKTVVAKHINFILTSTHENLRAKPMFASGEATLSIFCSPNEPAESELRVQLTSDRHITIRIEPITGRFILGPTSKLAAEFTYRINEQCNDPATNAHTYIEELRQRAIMDDLYVRGSSLGWSRLPNPGVNPNDLRSVIPKNTSQFIWLQKTGWAKNWFFCVSMSVNGERWWLIETTKPAPDTNAAPNSKTQKKDPVKIISSIELPLSNVSPAIGYGFLANINFFAAALVSHYTIQKNLHGRRARHKLSHSSCTPSTVKLPALYLQPSKMLASLNQDRKFNAGKKMLLKDVIQLTFQGLEARTIHPKNIHTGPSSSPQNQAQTPGAGQQHLNALPPPKLNAPHEDVFVISEARLVFSSPPAALKIIKDSIDRDIAFHQTSGAFALRIRSRVGESIVPNLMERVVRIERLVNFIQILQTQEKSVHCETISLGRITFTYGKVSLDAKGKIMETDGDRPREHTAVVDFSAADNMMKLILERGNPHLEIIDHLTRILNGKQGLDGVANLLPLTLPILQGLDALENAWASIPQAHAFVNVRAADWYIIRYNISLPLPSSPNGPSPKTLKVMFQTKLRQRRGSPWWEITRVDSRGREPDGVDAALAPVWTANGNGWMGMRVSAVAQANGVEDLVGKIDEAMQKFVKGSGAAEAPANAPATSRAKAPAPQQKLQQPTPNQSQSQSQGRSNAMKREMEIVEID
ncbi:Mediator of RNA polymerase II transcription subunit, partial [Lachnellula suecica]